VHVPGQAGRLAVAAAAATWLGALAGLWFGVPGVIVVATIPIAALVLGRPGVAAVLAFACAGSLSGWAAAARAEATWSAPIPEGHIAVSGIVAEDGGQRRPGVLRPDTLWSGDGSVPWKGPALAVEVPAGARLVAGDRVLVEGTARPRTGVVRGDPVAGRIAAERIERLGTTGGLLFALGNAVRNRVAAVIPSEAATGALLRGFLIGDTDDLPAADADALRRSGLTHFVAVSGSNVALFLGGWWLVTAPFGLGSRRRFLLGLVGLAVFVVATRWEASVIRAAAMAGLVLGGAAAGVVVDGWMALGGAVTLLLLGSGGLALDVGFQLSVAATAGILAGAGLGRDRRPRLAWTALAAAASAQLAVVPVLLLHFGRVPLLSPVANLLAAPLVSVATVLAMAAVLTGWGPLVGLASIPAGIVLGVARVAAGWPQLGPLGVVVGLAVAGIAVVRRWRPLVAVAAAIALSGVTIAPLFGGSATTITALDIGQGDAVLLRSEGRTVLVDGGHDPALLAERLRSHGVGRIDLLVATHGDADHAGGLDGIFASHGVGRLWVPAFAYLGPTLDPIVEQATAAGVAVQRVASSSVAYRIGSMRIEVLSPRRRYLGDNDGSIVLWVEAERSVLLGGDIEAVAQLELPALSPDILLVPHHGSATTDLGWLERTVGEVAIVSVGPNRFGHPSPDVMAVLDESGAEVLITEQRGDVTVDF
jgi:competence protein ComEC